MGLAAHRRRIRQSTAGTACRASIPFPADGVILSLSTPDLASVSETEHPMLDGFFAIESWSTDAQIFSVRLVPDHFEEELSEPVVTISVTDLQNRAECEAALLLRKVELIVDLEASDCTAAIHAEQDSEPLLLRGSKVSVIRGPYSFPDLLAIIRQKDQELDQCHEQLRIYRTTLESTEGLLSELIRRAEIKRDLTSRNSAWLDRELGVLQRVLQRIRER
jgi:hypothetical protein